MKKATIVDVLQEASSNSYAIGAFNILDYITAKAVITAAEECGKPVILQTSVGTVKYYGAKQLSSMVQYLKESANVPVFLHLDHCQSVPFAKECVDAGWDSIMIDASKLPFQENIRQTREAADYAHAYGVFAEGELGIIEGVEEDICADTGKLADYNECFEFVEESHIDFFAPAIGTAHGVYKKSPRLDFDLVKALGREMKQPIVCHGGTGLSDETFQKLITLGISKINVSTALKHSYMDAAKIYLDSNIADYAPMKLIAEQCDSVKEMAKRLITVFSN